MTVSIPLSPLPGAEFVESEFVILMMDSIGNVLFYRYVAQDDAVFVFQFEVNVYVRLYRGPMIFATYRSKRNKKGLIIDSLPIIHSPSKSTSSSDESTGKVRQTGAGVGGGCYEHLF